MIRKVPNNKNKSFRGVFICPMCNDVCPIFRVNTNTKIQNWNRKILARYQ